MDTSWGMNLFREDTMARDCALIFRRVDEVAAVAPTARMWAGDDAFHPGNPGFK